MKQRLGPFMATILLLAGCGDPSAPVPGPGVIEGVVAVAENPTPGYNLNYGFGEMFGYWRYYEQQYGTCYPGHCWELAVTNGPDTVHTDAYGRFRFESVAPGWNRIHVVEEAHPRFHRRHDGETSCRLGEDGSTGCTFGVPSTFWHFVEFDTLRLRVPPGGTVSDTIQARQRNVSIHRLLVTRGMATTPVEGVRMEKALDTVTAVVLETRYTDAYGEVVLPTRFERCRTTERSQSCEPTYYTRLVDPARADDWGRLHNRWRRAPQVSITTVCRDPRLIRPCKRDSMSADGAQTTTVHWTGTIPVRPPFVLGRRNGPVGDPPRPDRPGS